MRQYYTDIANLRQPASGLVREEIPERVRNAVKNHVYSFTDTAQGDLWHSILSQIDWSMDQHHDIRFAGAHGRNAKALRDAVSSATWPDFLDLLSALYYALGDIGAGRSTDFREVLNESLICHYSAYAMDDNGAMREVGSSAGEQELVEARGILRDPSFNGPDRQFQDALLDLQRRPNPNFEGAVSSSWNAVEGVARILVGNNKLTLGAALKHVENDKILHAALLRGPAALYGFASDEGGRHGVVGAAKISQPVAEFCVHSAAATIVFLARLYGIGIVEGSEATARRVVDEAIAYRS